MSAGAVGRGRAGATAAAAATAPAATRSIDTHAPRAEVLRVRLIELHALDVGVAPIEFTGALARAAICDAGCQEAICARINGRAARFDQYFAAVYGEPLVAKEPKRVGR